MWRSRVGALLLLAWTAGETRAQTCLPPFVDDGARLYGPAGNQVLWLDPLLRQHEACWLEPHRQGEKRVFVFGNSGVLGFPHPNDQSAVGLVNTAFAEADVPARLFNLGMPWTFAPKDALIIRGALAYRPDVLVYAVTLDDTYHQAPAGVAGLDAFFLKNSDTVDRFAAEDPSGIREPLEKYSAYWAGDWPLQPLWRHFRQSGAVVRVGVAQLARVIRQRWFPDAPYDTSGVEQAGSDYDCAEIVKRFDLYWKGGRDWSLLPYLAQLRRAHGLQILVVNWPVAHEPRSDCYNARYSTREFDDYNSWLSGAVATEGFHYLDLHDALSSGDFIDSIHPNADGQRLVAGRLEAAVLQVLAGDKFADASR